MRVPARAPQRGGINEIHVSRHQFSEGSFGAVIGVAPQELMIVRHRAYLSYSRQPRKPDRKLSKRATAHGAASWGTHAKPNKTRQQVSRADHHRNRSRCKRSCVSAFPLTLLLLSFQ